MNRTTDVSVFEDVFEAYKAVRLRSLYFTGARRFAFLKNFLAFPAFFK